MTTVLNCMEPFKQQEANTSQNGNMAFKLEVEMPRGYSGFKVIEMHNFGIFLGKKILASIFGGSLILVRIFWVFKTILVLLVHGRKKCYRTKCYGCHLLLISGCFNIYGSHYIIPF